MSLQRLEPKMFGKNKQNGVSTPHVLSMRPYAHIRAKHVKKGYLVKTCHFTRFNSLMLNQASHTNKSNMLTKSNK